MTYSYATQDEFILPPRDRVNRLAVRSWLYLVTFLVCLMIVVGGATRLTDSGLSITEWQPILGVIPPLDAEDWAIAFDKYREIPEYQQINKGMSLDEFKFIYWWEWGHRFLGRFIGFVVLLPMIYFWFAGMLEQRLKPRLLVLFALGAMQGAIGWWMVKSGLVDRVDVSQYRLAIHLTLAFMIFGYAFWLARGLAPHSGQTFSRTAEIWAPIITLAVLLQVFLGGLVAGLDAGLAFNDWPLMDNRVIPGDLFVREPAWINLFENPKTVQFMHRITAYAVFLLAFLQMIMVWRSSCGPTHKRRTVILFVAVTIQAAIGIVTLVLQVPIGWALLHQAGAAVLLAICIAHWRGLRGSYPFQTAIVRAD